MEELELKLDTTKLIKMLLIHDLPEITYGDIPAWDKNDREARKEREHQNAKHIFNKLPSDLAHEFNTLFVEFNEGCSLEARLAQAVEKIESQLQHLESGPQYWNEEKRGDHMINYPNRALAELNNSSINALWDEIKKELSRITKSLS